MNVTPVVVQRRMDAVSPTPFTSPRPTTDDFSDSQKRFKALDLRQWVSYSNNIEYVDVPPRTPSPEASMPLDIKKVIMRMTNLDGN